MPSQDLEGKGNPSYRVAGLFAFRFVSQVLDEAQIIANAAVESGRPWDYYIPMRKNMIPDLTYVIPSTEDIACNNSTGDKFIEGDDVANIDLRDSDLLMTSTPQKITEELELLIGQGDENVEQQNELSNSTSMFINHLFDLSDVEHVICDDTEILQDDSESSVVLAEAETHIIETFDETALDPLDQTHEKEAEEIAEMCCSSTGHSSFSFLTEEIPGETKNDVVIFVGDDIPSCTDKVSELVGEPGMSKKALHSQEPDALEEIKAESSELYENAYLSLNRDYDQCSDEDGFPILQDPKGMIMQEIELLTADTSADEADTNIMPDDEPEEAQTAQKGGLAATSGVSASSRKSNLVRRCRIQGARLLACLRGWWRRKTPGKRKEPRISASRHGLYPMSPCNRRKSSSLLDARSPGPARVAWKFNTINEALVNSSVWKEYLYV